jgi:2-methylcitrate dehydratase PrpD
MHLGQTYEILSNSYKPFACGIVIHPVIDGCVRLRNRHGLKADDVEAVEARVHPLVLELTGKTEPQRGLEGKFSVYHSAAVALIDGQAAEQQYSDARVRDATVVTLRRKVTATVDPSIHEDQAVVRVRLTGGRVVEERIEHAIGSIHQPMSDADLEAKFRALAGNVLDRESIDHAIELVWDLDKLPDVRPLIAACRGGRV